MVQNIDLNYNKKTHKFLITEEGFEERFGVQLLGLITNPITTNEETAVKVFINKVSTDVYTFIYSKAYDKDITEYKLATEIDLIECLEEVLYEYANSLIYNGSIYDGNYVKESGISVTNEDLDNNFPIICFTLLEARGLLRTSKYVGFDKNKLKERGVSY